MGLSHSGLLQLPNVEVVLCRLLLGLDVGPRVLLLSRDVEEGVVFQPTSHQLFEQGNLARATVLKNGELGREGGD